MDLPHDSSAPDSGRRHVVDFAEGAVIDQPLMVGRAELRRRRDGEGQYLAGIFTDQSGQIDFRLWDANRGMLDVLYAGAIVQVRGAVEEYRGTRQINVTGFEPAQPGEVDARDFLPHSRFDPKALFEELTRLLGGLANPYLAQLRDRYLEDREGFMKPFYYAPAAVRNHHPWRHGLLEHTVSALQLADRVCSHYPRLDRDVVLMAVFLHDAGKITELTRAPSFSYTMAGEMLGHISLGLMMLDRKIGSVPGFPSELKVHLEHCILAHHGVAEFGSPRPPMSPEALAVHHIECLDAHLSAMWLDQTELADPAADEVDTVYSKRFRHPLRIPNSPPNLVLPPPHLPFNDGGTLSRATPERASSTAEPLDSGAAHTDLDIAQVDPDVAHPDSDTIADVVADPAARTEAATDTGTATNATDDTDLGETDEPPDAH